MIKIFETEEEARAALDSLPPNEEAVARAKREAARHREAKEESFARCDTDGFLTQWAHDVAAGREHLQRKIEEHDGCYLFRVLVRLDSGELAAFAREEFTSRFHYGTDTMWKIERPRATERRWLPVAKRESTYARKGFKTAWLVAPAYADITGTGYGLSGNAWAVVEPDYNKIREHFWGAK